ncbi:iron chelate uptake ABC transporter family permease subunit, partial [Pseudomonas aeruginosa]|uniref:iron chelate uptake ABC transporter family permease subunit n=1 Tax=Pseudomonas aeruginosa TaxID=287 RepID=UPI00215615E9
DLAARRAWLDKVRAILAERLQDPPGREELARRLTRSAGVPLLSGALMGAVLLLAADLLGQRLAYVANLPIGLMTGLLGGFYLLWLLLRSRRI